MLFSAALPYPESACPGASSKFLAPRASRRRKSNAQQRGPKLESKPQAAWAANKKVSSLPKAAVQPGWTC